MMARKAGRALGARWARQGSIVAALVLALCAETRAADVLLAKDGGGTPLAREAVELCLEASATGGEKRDGARAELLERGLAVAEEAVRAADRDPKAHFAVFCNLGRKLESEGASLSSVAKIERMKREIDLSLALAPTFVDALAAKGAMLVRLPGLMGGDADEGERLIRRAVALAPDHAAARLELAKALAEKGERDKALAEARGAMQLAQQSAGSSELREAQQLAAELGS